MEQEEQFKKVSKQKKGERFFMSPKETEYVYERLEEMWAHEKKMGLAPLNETKRSNKHKTSTQKKELAVIISKQGDESSY